MIFTEIDKTTMQALTTLVKLSEPIDERKSAIIRAAQYMGVPKDDTLELLEEWDDADTITFGSEREKRKFLDECFSYMKEQFHPRNSEVKLYHYVAKNLGLSTRSNN